MSNTSFFSHGNSNNIDPQEFLELVKTLEGLKVDVTEAVDLTEARANEALASIDIAKGLVESTALFVQEATVNTTANKDAAQASADAAAVSAAEAATVVANAAAEAAVAAKAAVAEAQTDLDNLVADAANWASVSAEHAADAGTQFNLAAAEVTKAKAQVQAALDQATAAANQVALAKAEVQAAKDQVAAATTQAQIATTQAGLAAAQVPLAAAEVAKAQTKVEAAAAHVEAAEGASVASMGYRDEAKLHADAAKAASAAATTGQVQSDWLETDTAQKSYVRNKPALAPVATVGTYASLTGKPTLFNGTYDALTGKPVIPSNTNQLTNGANFITTAGARTAISVTGDLTYDNATGVIGHAAPTLAPVASTGDYADLTNKPTIPSDTAQLANTAGFITSAQVPAASPVKTVAGRTGTVVLGKADVSLGNVDNTSDANKPVSTAQQTALDLKQDKANKDASGGYAGLTEYKLNLKNADGSVVSQLTSIASVARNWSLPDKSGTLATLDDVKSSASATVITGDTVVSEGNHTVAGNYKLTLPDLTNPKLVTVTSASNATSVPTTMTCADGWTVDTGFTVGTTKTISPTAFGNPHGWWGDLLTKPPVFSERTLSHNYTGTAVPQIAGHLKINGVDLLWLRYTATDAGSNNFLVAVDQNNNETSAILVTPVYSTNETLNNCALLPVGANGFAMIYNSYRTDAGGTNHSPVVLRAGKLAGAAITLGADINLTYTGTLASPPIKLGETFALLLQAGNNLMSFTVDLNTLTATNLQAYNTQYAYSYTRMVKIDETTALVAYATAAKVIKTSGTGLTVGAANSLVSMGGDSAQFSNLYPFGDGVNAALQTMASSQISGGTAYRALIVSGTTVTASNALHYAGAPYQANSITGYAYNSHITFRDLSALYAYPIQARSIAYANTTHVYLFTLKSDNSVVAHGIPHNQAGRMLPDYSRKNWIFAGSTTYKELTFDFSTDTPTVALGPAIAGAVTAVFTKEKNDAVVVENGALFSRKGFPKQIGVLSESTILGYTSGSPAVATLYKAI